MAQTTQTRRLRPFGCRYARFETAVYGFIRQLFIYFTFYMIFTML